MRSYKKYVAWKNAPPAPAKPVPPATSDLSDLPVARTAQRMQNDATNPPTSASTMYQAAPVHARAVPSPAPQVIEKEKVIIKEVIKVRCGWCGTLVDQGMAECPHCAGRL
ncbi:MAG: hypothetical protein GYA24_15120 [Candidatus Lokiarchaeota archaeon]|nr:hypothetical protein [Candidatus Lokiarchaeota archaeon]